MAKDRSFASKVSKAQHETALHCATCGEETTALKVVQAVKSTKKDSHKFNEKFVRICKCNEKEYLGWNWIQDGIRLSSRRGIKIKY